MVQKQRDAKTVDAAKYIYRMDVKLKQILVQLNFDLCKSEKTFGSNAVYVFMFQV